MFDYAANSDFFIERNKIGIEHTTIFTYTLSSGFLTFCSIKAKDKIAFHCTE